MHLDRAFLALIWGLDTECLGHVGDLLLQVLEHVLLDRDGVLGLLLLLERKTAKLLSEKITLMRQSSTLAASFVTGEVDR